MFNKLGDVLLIHNTHIPLWPCTVIKRWCILYFLSGCENVLKRVTIVGVILSFRSMIQDALGEVNVSIYVS